MAEMPADATSVAERCFNGSEVQNLSIPDTSTTDEGGGATGGAVARPRSKIAPAVGGTNATPLICAAESGRSGTGSINFEALKTSSNAPNHAAEENCG